MENFREKHNLPNLTQETTDDIWNLPRRFQNEYLSLARFQGYMINNTQRIFYLYILAINNQETEFLKISFILS